MKACSFIVVAAEFVFDVNLYIHFPYIANNKAFIDSEILIHIPKYNRHNALFYFYLGFA